MSSSISSSEAAASRAWGRWLLWFAAIFFGGIASLYLLVVVCDPYSTGRFTPFTGVDIAIGYRHLANAGRARDQQFDAAIFGNSHAARLDPPRLDVLSGRRFVQLSVVTTGPNEQIAIARAFARAHAAPAPLLVWVIDHYWCHGEHTPPYQAQAFPHWLYEFDDGRYLLRIFSADALQAAVHRIGIRLFNARPAAPADGRPEGDGALADELAAGGLARMRAGVRPAGDGPSDVRFPSIERLAAFIGGLPPDVTNVLVFPPYHISAIPQPGSPADRSLNACKARLRALADARPGTVVVDRMLDDAAARDASNFWDDTHIKDPIVRTMEADIARAITARGK
jgi:hypothetical protein